MTPTSRARWRMAAWPLLVLGVLVGGVLVCEWQGWPFLKGPAQRTLTERLQRPMEFGDTFRLKLFGSLRLDTSALRIGPPSGLPADSLLGGDLVNARDAHLDVPYSTLIHLMRKQQDEPLRITSLRFGELNATLKRQADGVANWQFSKAPSDPAHKQFEMPEVDELAVQRGHLVYDDALLRTAIDAQVSTSEGERAGQGLGGLLVQGKGQREGRPFDFRVASSGVLPLISRDRSTRVPVTIRLNAPAAKFSFEGTGTDLLSFESIDGAAMLAGSSLAKVGDAVGVTLPTTEAFTLKGRLGKAGNLWSLKDIDLAVGDSHLGGAFSFDRRSKVPMLSGDLTGSRLVLADLLPAFGAARPGSGNPKPPSGHVVPQREFDIPSLHAMNANVKVRLARAELGALFREPLAPLQADLRLDNGVLQLDNLLARAAGGQVKGKLGLDANQANPLWTADLRWAGIELDQILRPRNPMSQTSKPSGENPSYVTGKIGGHAQLQARGKSTSRMLASTDGTVQAWVRDGTISHLVLEASGLDIAQALGVALIGDKQLPMQCAVLKANAKGGQLTPEVALIDTTDTTLLISGNVNLADERLALTMTARPKDMSPATLRAPVHLDGSFEKPQIRIEKKPIALKLLAAAALSLVNPLAALIPLIDPGDKEAAGACQRSVQRLRDADGPTTARDARAPRATDKALTSGPAARQAAASSPIRK